MAETNGNTADPELNPSVSSSTDPPNAPAANPTTDSKPDAPASTDPPAAGARKPRDARIIHLILASMGVSAYQERVPLMLMDFAYRLSSLLPLTHSPALTSTGYTSSVLQDALLFSDAINGTPNTGGPNPPANISLADLRMSVASRINHQFNTALPKEFLLDIAQERNKIALPTVGKEFGVRLPPEKYSLTGINWDLAETREDWMDDSSADEEGDEGVGYGPTVALVGAGGDKMDVDDLFADEEEEEEGVDSSMPDA